MPASFMPLGEIDTAADDLEVLLHRPDLQVALLQLEPVGLHRHRFGAPQQRHDDAERLVLAVTQGHRVDAEGAGVGGQRTRAGAEDGPTPGQVVEQRDAAGHVVGVVVGQAHHTGGQLDAMGALGRGGEEHLGVADGLPAAGVVLPHPHLVVAELVEVLDQSAGPARTAASGARRPGGGER